jgi:hypothetical protein
VALRRVWCLAGSATYRDKKVVSDISCFSAVQTGVVYLIVIIILNQMQHYRDSKGYKSILLHYFNK